VGPKAGQDDVKKRKSLTLPELEIRPLGRPVCSQSLYRLLSDELNVSLISVLLNVTSFRLSDFLFRINSETLNPLGVFIGLLQGNLRILTLLYSHKNYNEICLSFYVTMGHKSKLLCL
jgi:hypothetical protein